MINSNADNDSKRLVYGIENNSHTPPAAVMM